MSAMAPLCPRGLSCRRANTRLLEAWRFQRRSVSRPTAFPGRKGNAASQSTTTSRADAAPARAPPAQSIIASQPAPSQAVSREVAEAEYFVSRILQADEVTEEEMLRALNGCKLNPSKVSSTASPTSAILSLDTAESEDAPSSPKSAASMKAEQTTRTQLANLAFKLVSDPDIFISPAVLHAYVTTVAELQRPQHLPRVLHLYANKPTFKYGTDPPQLKAANPRAIASAVPAHTADAALDAAIESKDLMLALDVIDQTYRAPAFIRAKIFKKASLPFVGMGLTPPLAYMAATKIADMQTGYEPEVMTQMAFMGIMAYVVGTGTVGFVALATANDHMQRVTWQDGIPLRERWMREEERAALDKVALAWGFKEVWRRGEEEGKEWEGLKEWVGLRGMVLDRVTLMEGMQ
jgi:hypothetical protein